MQALRITLLVCVRIISNPCLKETYNLRTGTGIDLEKGTHQCHVQCLQTKLSENIARSTAHQSHVGSSSYNFVDGHSAVSSSSSLSVDAHPTQQALANDHFGGA